MHRNVDEGDLVFREGVLVTSAARTVADLARTAAPLTAVAAGDAVLHRKLCTVEEVAYHLSRGRHGSRRGLMLLRRMDPACESPAETRSRLLIVDSGLPVPLTQQDVCDGAGVLLGRSDFLIGDLIGECDGEGKYFGRYSDRSVEEVLEDEKYRQQRFSTTAGGSSAGVPERCATTRGGWWIASPAPWGGEHLATARWSRPRHPTGDTGTGRRTQPIAGEPVRSRARPRSTESPRDVRFSRGRGSRCTVSSRRAERSRGARHVARAAKGSGL